MTQEHPNSKGNDLKDLFSNSDKFRKFIEETLNEVLEAEMTEHIGALPYERTGERTGYRNGYRLRSLYTRVGPLVLRVPQSRDGGFSTELFQRYQRSEQALVLSLMEMVVQGVSTRKVSAITEELCGTSFSKSTVSDLACALDLRVSAFNERSLSGHRYPFVFLDAMYIKVRRDEAVRSTGVLSAIGINELGYREVLGVRVGDSESEGSWNDTLAWLKERGLSGVEVVISDDHRGLVKAIQRQFQGASWQRCQVHLMRNVLGVTPRHIRDRMSAGLRRIFGSENRDDAWSAYEAVSGELSGRADRALAVLENGLDDVLTVLSLPERYRVRLRTTNMLERVHQELRRRERVIRIFPNEASALRLIGALLAEQHEVWSTGRRYFNMEEYDEWKAGKKKPSDKGINPQNVITVNTTHTI
jgi:transposase-like protein